MRGRLMRFWSNCRGASAVEFALVVPVFFALTIGTINLCVLIYMDSRLQFSVDSAARCGAIGTCTATTQAANMFGFTTFSPSFANPTVANCHGTEVTGSVTYRLNAFVTSISVPLSAKSCFATQD